MTVISKRWSFPIGPLEPHNSTLFLWEGKLSFLIETCFDKAGKIPVGKLSVDLESV